MAVYYYNLTDLELLGKYLYYKVELYLMGVIQLFNMWKMHVRIYVIKSDIVKVITFHNYLSHYFS